MRTLTTKKNWCANVHIRKSRSETRMFQAGPGKVGCKSDSRSGLVLLVVLGMLGLFTLLAVSYLSFTSQSRNASLVTVRNQLRKPSINQYDDQVVRQIVRGDESNRSAFFGHSLLEDVFGRDAIEGEFFVHPVPPPPTLATPSAVLNVDNQIGLVKLQLNPGISISPDSLRIQPVGSGANDPDENSISSFLSQESDTYTGRLITFLEGPLANQTYRILGYVGASANPLLRYSIAIDLSETDTPNLGYTVLNTTTSKPETYSGSLDDLLKKKNHLNSAPTAPYDPSFLVVKDRTNNIGFRYVINDMPFNGFGYGIENAYDTTRTYHPNYGNLDQGLLVPGTRINTNDWGYADGRESVPLALLPNYDYLKKQTGSSALGSGQINGTGSYVEVNGSTNEGFDVADFHDYFLAHIPAPATAGGLPEHTAIIPSFHRPEIVNYLAHWYISSKGDINTTTATHIQRLVTLIDYACARPLSYTLRNGTTVLVSKNPNFTGRPDSKSIPTLDIDLNNWPNNATSVAALHQWLGALAGAPGDPAVKEFAYDVDNEGDGVAESVWTDPNLPLVFAREGQSLKALAATTIIPLDGRINLNTAGDRSQEQYVVAANDYQTTASRASATAIPRDYLFGRRDSGTGTTNGIFLPQGLGYGPAEIFLPRLARNQTDELLHDRYGSDQSPGRSGTNELLGRYTSQREMYLSGSGTPYGLRLARNGRKAMSFDLNGQPRMADSSAAANGDEILDDAYESNSLSNSTGDEGFRLVELEALLRRYDSDSRSLPSRIRTRFESMGPLNDEIVRSLTTRSVELRYPNAAAIARHTQPYSNTSYPRVNGERGTGTHIPVPTPGAKTRLVTNSRNEGSMLRWIQMLYEERYADRLTRTQPLELSAIRELFPLEFRKGLRLDINRPLGNGVDNDSDGLIDEPDESSGNQLETFASDSVNGTYHINTYPPTSPTNPDYVTYAGRSWSRKMFARQLYCLAQLVVARDYPFGGLSPNNDPGDLSIPTNREYARLRARELSQWAVNVVDFRDHDATMTRFEYDELPFEIEPSDTNVWNPKNDNVVWGMEFPELIMTETFSCHDKRVADTDYEPGRDTTVEFTRPAPASVDTDFDQLRIPQGSSFIELLAVRSANSPVAGTAPVGDLDLGIASPELYLANGQLNLSAMAPAATARDYGLGYSANYGSQPVFRIGIARLPAGEDPGTQLAAGNFDELHRRTNQTSLFGTPPSTVSPPPSAYELSGLVPRIAQTATRNFPGVMPAAPLSFDRMVWFTNTTVGTNQSIPDLFNGDDPASAYFSERPHRVYRSTTGGLSIEGGSYLVVGPRDVTHFGSLNVPGLPSYNPNPHRIVMGAGSVTIYDHNNNDMRNTGWRTKTPVGCIAVASPPIPDWTTSPDVTRAPLANGVGFNISEPTPSPARYYAMPSSVLNSLATAPNNFPPRFDAYTDVGLNQYTTPDEPFDSDGNPLLERLAAENKQRPGTYPVHRTAFLQRLADPGIAYHPIYNPYITIDWMNMDLTVFNGEDEIPVDDPTRTNPTDGMPDPYIAPVDETINPSRPYAFETRYKDGARANDTPNNQNAVPLATATAVPRYAHITGGAPNDVQTGVSFFSSSTAFLIESTNAASLPVPPPFFQHLLGQPAGTTTGPSSATLGYLNVGRQLPSGQFDGFGPPTAAPSVTGVNVGAPQLPMAGLVWLNRSFASPCEIMLVPRVGPGQLGQTFTTPTNANSGRYETAARGGGNFLPMYGHLPNFFSSEVPKTTGGGGDTFWQRPAGYATGTVGTNWSLLLELIETPSPYPDTAGWVRPTQLINGTANRIDPALLGGYAAPFHFFSKYVATGKVNLNAITEQGVWEAIEGNYDMKARTSARTATEWNDFLNQRRGFAPSAHVFLNGTNENPNLHAEIPTQFAQPYRSGFGTNMDVMGTTLKDNPSASRGLLRSEIADLTSNPVARNPDNMLLNPDPIGQQLDPNNADSAVTPRIEAELLRQPFVNYQRAMRLPNLVTNQSNVFAVWVTIGLFEYDEATGIGAEYVGPSGTVERTKSFYIIDRSIPVGFAPGKNYNAEKTILLRRKISQ